MTTRQDVARLAEANRGIVKMARADLEKLFAKLAEESDDPEGFGRRLAEVLPLLVAEYGNLAAAVASEWYGDMRERAGVGGSRVERLSDGAAPAAVVGSAYAAAAGFAKGGTMQAAFGFAEGAMQRHISFSTRDTIRSNARSDPAKPSVAVSVTSADPCDYCADRASGGAYSAKADGDLLAFHDGCNCMVTVDFTS